ncbi:MAG TPA: beta-ketoacyl-[acyl-carrier-protein] synthase family protein, partial [Dongiaceae bacterium]|nr:beta-ketoacyl-[acyl-carrier-protein] synthase family protein [Dongiaceae bacterium]
PLAHFEEKRLVMLDRFTQFALIAAREAVAQSGLPRAGGLGEDSAAIIGTGVGGQTTVDDSYRRLYGERVARVHPFTVPRMMANAAASHVSMEFGITGPAFAVSSACASANHAIGLAFDMVRRGQMRAAIAGGSEACITVGSLKGWEALRVLATDTCRPFCRDRRGMVLGEGAGIFVLETLETARARGAPILAELAGFGMSADAADLVLPSEAGAARAIAGALKDAGLAPERIDYINAHGTGTAANDVTETRALRRVFGDHAGRLAVSSTKAVHGHALGAAGAIELVAAVRAITDGVVPPTANFTAPDPDCDLDYVPNEARERTVGAALSNSFAFGGLNAVLALRRVE